MHPILGGIEMTQLYPSTDYESKAVALIMEMRNFLLDAQDRLTVEEANAKFRDIQTRFNEVIGKPLTEYEPFSKSEPSRSDKFNRFINNLQKDINILEDQVELMRASAVYLYNNMGIQIQKAKNENSAVANKLKSLQLYTSAQNNEITIFGDYFRDDNFVDLNLTSKDTTAILESEKRLTLSKSTVSDVNPLVNAKVTVLSTSNGFPGRLVEVEELNSNSPSNPATSNKMYRFSAEYDQRSNPLYITDNSPASWFEYEKNLISEEDRVSAKNLNFKYKVSDKRINKNILEINYPVSVGEEIDWADGPSGNILKLDLQFDLKEVKTINEITYIPFGLENNKNYPVYVKSVETSLDANEWDTLYPSNVAIAQDVNIDMAKGYGEVLSSSATWNLRNDQIRYIRFHIEQPNPIESKIGHLYYLTPKKVIRQATMDGATPNITEMIVGGDRAEGPTPDTDNPTKYYDPSFSLVSSSNVQLSSNLVKNVEIFNGKRWAIGIRDITARQVKYSEFGEIITKPFKINGIIDRVSLESSIYIPESFSSSILWVKYFISPNDGKNWYPISRIQDDYLSIPEILAFNDPTPLEFREQNVGYYTVTEKVNSLRLKIQLGRPSDQPNLTPIVRWYKLKVRRK